MNCEGCKQERLCRDVGTCINAAQKKSEPRMFTAVAILLLTLAGVLLLVATTS